MTITSYDDLCTLAKIVYALRENHGITSTKIMQLVAKGKISQEEADFILARFPDE